MVKSPLAEQGFKTRMLYGEIRDCSSFSPPRPPWFLQVFIGGGAPGQYFTAQAAFSQECSGAWCLRPAQDRAAVSAECLECERLRVRRAEGIVSPP